MNRCCYFFFFLLKRVESFLHKDVSFLVTGSQEGLKEQRHVVTEKGTKESEEAQCPIKQRESLLSKDRQRPATPRPVVLLSITCMFLKPFTSF